MNDFGINEMQEMQKALQEKYKDKWEGISPEIGKNKLLWMIGEIGEVIDIIKKNGGEKACKDEALRKDLIEEMADVQVMLDQFRLSKPDWRCQIDSIKQAKVRRQIERMSNDYKSNNLC